MYSIQLQTSEAFTYQLHMVSPYMLYHSFK